MSKGIKTYLAKKKNMRKNVSSKMQNKRFNRNTKRVGNKKWGGDDNYGDIEEITIDNTPQNNKSDGNNNSSKSNNWTTDNSSNLLNNSNSTEVKDFNDEINNTSTITADTNAATTNVAYTAPAAPATTTNVASTAPADPATTTNVASTPPANRFTPGKDDPSKANKEIRDAVNELKEMYNEYRKDTTPNKSKTSKNSKIWTKGVIGEWDVSNVTDMSNLFMDFHEFDEPLNDWVVSNVTNMKEMFSGCLVSNADTTDKGMFGIIAANFKQELTNLNNIRTHEFSYCMNFNKPLNKWVVSKVTDMSKMFVNCKKFNQPLDSWNVNPTTNMSFMFSRCENFNQPAIIEKWNLLYMPNKNKYGMFLRTLMENSVIMNKLPTKPYNMKEDDIKADDTIERVLYYKINPDEIPTACSICGQVIKEGGFAPTKCQNKYHYKCLFDKCNGQAECKCNCGRKLIFPSEQIGLVDEANIGNGYPVEGGKTKRRSKKNQRKTRKSRKNKK